MLEIRLFYQKCEMANNLKKGLVDETELCFHSYAQAR